MAQTLGPVVEERHSSVPELCGRWRLRCAAFWDNTSATAQDRLDVWLQQQSADTEVVQVSVIPGVAGDGDLNGPEPNGVMVLYREREV